MATAESTSTMRNNNQIRLRQHLSERIARLEERSQHAATVAQLHRVALTIIIGIVGTLGGLIIHLHNQQIALIERLLAN